MLHPGQGGGGGFRAYTGNTGNTGNTGHEVGEFTLDGTQVLNRTTCTLTFIPKGQFSIADPATGIHVFGTLKKPTRRREEYVSPHSQ